MASARTTVTPAGSAIDLKQRLEMPVYLDRQHCAPGRSERHSERAQPGPHFEHPVPGPTFARRAMRSTTFGSTTKFCPSARRGPQTVIAKEGDDLGPPGGRRTAYPGRWKAAAAFAEVAAGRLGRGDAPQMRRSPRPRAARSPARSTCPRCGTGVR